ncbi:MAG: hypothetical protein ACOC9P_01110 [bacterium]
MNEQGHLVMAYIVGGALLWGYALMLYRGHRSFSHRRHRKEKSS